MERDGNDIEFIVGKGIIYLFRIWGDIINSFKWNKASNVITCGFEQNSQFFVNSAYNFFVNSKFLLIIYQMCEMD